MGSITATSASPGRATAPPTAGCPCRSCRSATATDPARCSSRRQPRRRVRGDVDLHRPVSNAVPGRHRGPAHLHARRERAGRLCRAAGRRPWTTAARATSTGCSRGTSTAHTDGNHRLVHHQPADSSGSTRSSTSTSAGSSSDHWPSCKIRLMGDETRDAMQMEFLKLFGAPLALVGDRVHETTLSGEALPRDIIYVSTELGGAGRITPLDPRAGRSGAQALPEAHGHPPGELPPPTRRSSSPG